MTVNIFQLGAASLSLRSTRLHGNHLRLYCFGMEAGFLELGAEGALNLL